MLGNMSNQAELSEAVRSILRALAELSAAQAALDQNPEQATAPRDHYARKDRRGVPAVRSRRQKQQEPAHNLDPPYARRQRINRLESIASIRGAGRQ
jgi:hypothetical protein